ncbi:MAG: hypothetical protein WAW88_06230 [Nocardioides sp.]
MRRFSVALWVVVLLLLNVAAVAILSLRMRPDPSVATEAADSATEQPTASDSPVSNAPWEGLVFLAGADDGSVLRVSHGSCRSQHARAWIFPGRRAAGEPTAIEGLARVLAVSRVDDQWQVIGQQAGSGEQCPKVLAWRSASLTAGPWKSQPVPRDSWYLDPQDNSAIVTPRGRFQPGAGCTPQQLDLVEGVPFLLCSEGQVYTATDPDRQGESLLQGLTSAPQPAAMAPTSDNAVAFVGREAGCGASVFVLTQSRSSSHECLAVDRAPLGLTWAGRVLVAQIGYDLMQRDLKGNWAVRAG